MSPCSIRVVSLQFNLTYWLALLLQSSRIHASGDLLSVTHALLFGAFVAIRPTTLVLVSASRSMHPALWSYPTA